MKKVVSEIRLKVLEEDEEMFLETYIDGDLKGFLSMSDLLKNTNNSESKTIITLLSTIVQHCKSR